MCWAEKCCYFIPLNFAGVILGLVNLATSFSLAMACLIFFCSTRHMDHTLKESNFIAPTLGLDLKMETMTIIITVVIIVSVFWIIFSIFLIVGTIRNSPCLILSYFAFGIILTIIFQLSGLLMLINHFWWLALFVFIGSFINIHFLVVVHTVYELMQKGTYQGFGRRQSDEDRLADCFDENLA